MANVLNRTTGNLGVYPYDKDYRQSVSENEIDYPQTEWIWNPDLSQVVAFDDIYWDISGDSVTLADSAERGRRDADIAAQNQLIDNQNQKDAYTSNQIFRAQIKYVVDEINILRQNVGLTQPRTYAQAQQYMFDAIDNGEV